MEQLKAEDLSIYLASYLRKCMDFERTKGQHRKSDYYGVIENGLFKNQQEAFAKITTESLDSTEAYWEVREAIHHYQRANAVSGIVWNEIAYRGKTVRVPRLHDQLVSVPGDKEILIAATSAILNWWAEVTEGMDLWKSTGNDQSVPITLEQILPAALLAEWAEISLWDSPISVVDEEGEKWVEARLDLNLQLCWGIPDNVAYSGYPESGSEWFYATPRTLNQSELENLFTKGW